MPSINKSNNQYIISFIFIVHSLCAIILFHFHQEDFINNSTTLLTYDSLLYRDRAIEFCTSDIPVLEFIKQYGLNYSAISIFGSISCFFGGFSDFFILITNILLMGISYIFIIKVLNESDITLDLKGAFILLVFLYIPFSMIMLNKEIIGFSFISTLIYFYYKRSWKALILIGLIFGFFRIQYFVIVLMLLLFKKPNLIVLLTIINILVILFIPPFLQQWSIHIGNEEVNSLKLMLFLEKVAYIPLIGALAYMVRIIISLFVGLKAPLDLLTPNLHMGTFIYLESIFLLSILTLFYLLNLLKIRKRMVQLPHRNLFISINNVIIVFLAVNSIAPFLQPRYYLPLIIPFIINVIIMKHTYKLKVEKK